MAVGAGNYGQTIRSNEFTANFNFFVNTGSDMVLLLGILARPGDTLVSCTYGGVAMTQIAVVTANSPDGPIFLFQLVNPATGAMRLMWIGQDRRRTVPMCTGPTPESIRPRRLAIIPPIRRCRRSRVSVAA